jgi:cytochrome o ubiquinol oxidase subunit 2
VPEKEYEQRMKEARRSEIALTAETYAVLARQGTSEEAKKPLGIPDQKGPIEMTLSDPRFFDRVLARYQTGRPMTPETQPGSPAYDPAKAILPPAPAKPMMNM